MQVVETVVVTLPRYAGILIPRGGIAHPDTSGYAPPAGVYPSP